MNNLASYISIDPDIRFGKPCIKGTRIAITDILLWLASGMTIREIMDDFPILEEIHIEQLLIKMKNQITLFISSSEYGVLELV